MSRDDDELDGREFPDESDMDDSDAPEMLECPKCGKMISEDTEWCHHCGWYLQREPVNPRIWYWILVGMIALGAVAMIRSFRML